MKLEFRIIELGNVFFFYDFERLRSWGSKFFQVSDRVTQNLLPPTGNNEYSYSDNQLSKMISPGSGRINLALINAPLQDGFYLRIIHSNTIVLSIFEMVDFLRYHNVPVENFIIKTIYEIVVGSARLEGNITDDAYELAHEDTRGCLFDLNPFKTDIVFTLDNLSLSTECLTDLQKKALPSDFSTHISKELKRIVKPSYYRIADFVKQHPYLAISISLVTAFTLNLFSSFAYDFIKSY